MTNLENLCTKSMYKFNRELFSCITDSGRVQSREGNIQNFCIISSLKVLTDYQNLLKILLLGFFLLTQSTLFFQETSSLNVPCSGQCGAGEGAFEKESILKEKLPQAFMQIG